MGTGIGRKVIVSLGRAVRASATDDTEYKVAGITLDWSTVTAVNSDTVLPDGVTIPNGKKGLQFGTILAKIANGTIQTVTINGGPTGGTFTLGVNIGGVQTTAAIAYNAAASAVQTALAALSNVGTGNVAVSGSAGGPYTVTFQGALKAVVVPQMAHTDSLTGGTSPAVAVAVVNTGQTTTNYYGPADTSVHDGRQTLGVGETFVLDQTVLEEAPFGFTSHLTNHPPVIDGGTVWLSRLQVGGNNQPTLAQVLAVLPNLKVLEDA